MIVDSAPPDNKITPSTIDSGSEEDDVVILNPDDMSKPISRLVIKRQYWPINYHIM